MGAESAAVSVVAVGGERQWVWGNVVGWVHRWLDGWVRWMGAWVPGMCVGGWGGWLWAVTVGWWVWVSVGG